MRVLHPTDEEIQQYVLDSSSSDKAITEHASSCEQCKAKVASYRLLFTAISQQPEESFDFDLAKLVMAQLPMAKPKYSQDNFFIYLLVFAAIILTGAALYYFRNYIASLFASIAPVFIYLITTTGITLAIILSIDMFKNYQKKMRALDLY